MHYKGRVPPRRAAVVSASPAAVRLAHRRAARPRAGPTFPPNGKLFTARWFFRKSDFTKNAREKKSGLRSESSERELWSSDATDDDQAVDAIERKCTVVWVAHDDDTWSAKVTAPFTFFYSRSFDPDKKTFSVVEHDPASVPQPADEAEDAPGEGQPPPAKRSKWTVATMAAYLEELHRTVATHERKIDKLEKMLSDPAAASATAPSPVPLNSP